MDDNELERPFSQSANSPFYLLGEQERRTIVANILKSLPFIYQRPMTEIFGEQAGTPFVVASCDMTDPAEVHTLIRCMTRIGNVPAVKILHLAQPEYPSLEHLIFGLHIGCEFVSWGNERATKLRQFIKNKSHQRMDAGQYSRANKQIALAGSYRDYGKLHQLARNISADGRDDARTLRLLIKINEHLNKSQRVLAYLLQMLQLNPQDIWAANKLALFHVEANDIGRGLELLESKSDFSALRGEASFSATLFEQTTLPKLSKTLLSFLNVRAVMAIRNNCIDEGINYYKLALAGSSEDVVLSKIHFNIGIAFLRNHQAQESVFHLEESLRLGTKMGYLKAKRPLETARKIASGGKKTSDSKLTKKDLKEDL